MQADVCTLMARPISQLSDCELASLRIVQNERVKGLPFLTGSLDADAWRESVNREQKESLPRDLLRFIDGQELMARLVRSLIADRGSTGADEILGFIADGGLSRDAMTAMVALREYRAFVSSSGVTSETVVNTLLSFCAGLEKTLQGAAA